MLLHAPLSIRERVGVKGINGNNCMMVDTLILAFSQEGEGTFHFSPTVMFILQFTVKQQ